MSTLLLSSSEAEIEGHIIEPEFRHGVIVLPVKMPDRSNCGTTVRVVTELLLTCKERDLFTALEKIIKFSAVFQSIVDVIKELFNCPVFWNFSLDWIGILSSKNMYGFPFP